LEIGIYSRRQVAAFAQPRRPKRLRRSAGSLATIEMERGKIDALTGLRFWAAALIVAEHARMLRVPLPAWGYDHGVSLFFVLSGFILTHVYPRLDDWRSARRFLVLRVARIWPAHVAVLALWLAAIGGSIFSAKFFANLLMIHAWIPSAPWYFSFNAPSWSISTEFFFYLAFPLLILGWRRSWVWKWLGAVGLLSAMIAIGAWARLPGYSPEGIVTVHGLVYVGPLGRILEFVTGMVAYSCFAALRPHARRLGLVTGSLLEIGVIAGAAYSIIDAPLSRLASGRFGLTGLDEWLAHCGSLPVFPILIVVVALRSGVISRFLGSRPIVLLGEVSYSIYLVHLGVYAVYVQHWMPAGLQPDYTGLAICLVVTLALSFAIWKLIETPARRAARRAVDGGRLGWHRSAWPPELAGAQAPAVASSGVDPNSV
jgi:peptidoglycan/LPS O-acetylase OafA/YrhL